METTRLSSKGQVIIPKQIRELHHWNTGLELEVIDTADGILLKPRAPFEKSTIEDVVGCLKYKGTAKSLEEIELAMKKAAKEAWRDSN